MTLEGADAMYKIGGFSKIVELSIRTLRYYDEIGLLKPTWIDEETGYRWYDEAAYQKAVIIKTLRRYEFSIQELLEAVPQIGGPDDLADYLKEKHGQLESRIASARTLQKEISKQIESMKEANAMEKRSEVAVKEVPEQLVATMRYKGKYSDMGNVIGQLFKTIGGNAKGSVFALYYDDCFMEDDADIEVAVPVKQAVNKNGVTSRVIGGQRCISVTHVGPYDRISTAYKAAMDFADEMGLKVGIPSREIYLKGPGMLFAGNPEKYETEVLLPVIGE